ncbi:MAG: hypothetical protein V3S89_01185 [Desulfobacterales bacterium]
MENIKDCAVIVRRSEDLWEATRTGLGLAAHNHRVHLYVLDFTVDMTEALKDYFEWFTEMECDLCSNLEANSACGFRIIPLEEIGAELKDMDLVIPFGHCSRPSRRHGKYGPPSGKTMLHILKTPPDDLQHTVMMALSRGNDDAQMPLFEQDDTEVDYGEVIDRIFEYDEVITWW